MFAPPATDEGTVPNLRFALRTPTTGRSPAAGRAR
jgi:hypothetical protein